MKKELFKMLKSQAEAERDKELLSLKLLGDHPVGIGDHSTEDFYKNDEEALQMLVDAEDKLAIIEKYSKIKY